MSDRGSGVGGAADPRGRADRPADQRGRDVDGGDTAHAMTEAGRVNREAGVLLSAGQTSRRSTAARDTNAASTASPANVEPARPAHQPKGWWYRKGWCTCDDCRAAWLRHRKRYEYIRRTRGPVLVPAVGTARRIQALLALGWPMKYVADLTGMQTDAVLRLTKQRLVTQETRARIADAYDKLSMTPGPSVRSRNRAARKGYAPPLAWDDDTIDDPDAQPFVADAPTTIDHIAIERFVAGDIDWRRLTTEERLAAVPELLRAGLTHNAIALRTHLNSQTLYRVLKESA